MHIAPWDLYPLARLVQGRFFNKQPSLLLSDLVRVPSVALALCADLVEMLLRC
jgi:hypothetical protein